MTSSVHHHAQRLLSASLDGEADPDGLALAQAHIRRCPVCQQTARDFDRVGTMTAVTLPAERPAWLDELPARLPERRLPPVAPDAGPEGEEDGSGPVRWRPSPPRQHTHASVPVGLAPAWAGSGTAAVRPRRHVRPRPVAAVRRRVPFLALLPAVFSTSV